MGSWFSQPAQIAASNENKEHLGNSEEGFIPQSVTVEPSHALIEVPSEKADVNGTGESVNNIGSGDYTAGSNVIVDVQHPKVDPKQVGKSSPKLSKIETAKRKLTKDFEKHAVPDKKPKTTSRKESVILEEPVHEVEELFVFEDLQINCDSCDRIFPTEAERVCHKPCFWIRNDLKKPPRFFSCRFEDGDDKCPKEYYDLGSLKNHMMTHFEGNFRCLVCSFRSAKKSGIAKHIGDKHDNLLREAKQTDSTLNLDHKRAINSFIDLT